jgi:nucleoid-associated protein YejK
LTNGRGESLARNYNQQNMQQNQESKLNTGEYLALWASCIVVKVLNQPEVIRPEDGKEFRVCQYLKSHQQQLVSRLNLSEAEQAAHANAWEAADAETEITTRKFEAYLLEERLWKR